MWLMANAGREGNDVIPLADFMPFQDRGDMPEVAAHPSVAMFEQMYAKFHQDD